MIIHLHHPPPTAIPPSSPTTKSKPPNAIPIPIPTSTDAGILFRQKIIHLQNLSINPNKALTLNPNIRSTPLQSIKSVETCLTSFGIERAALGRILDMFPQLLTADPYSDLYPVFDFLLNDVGLAFPNIRKAVLGCPRLLASSVDLQLKPTLKFLRDLGFVESKCLTSQNTVLLVSNVEHTLKPKLNYLLGLGFEYSEVVNMVLRLPGLLTYSVENNFKPKVEYFVKEMNGDLSELKRFPQFFAFSLEGRIKRRHRLLVEHGVSSMPLREMLIVSDGEFEAQLFDLQLHLVDGV